MALLVGLVLALTGCGRDDAAESANSMDERIAAAIEDAEANGASAQQLDLLRDAKQKGLVSFDDARSASLAAVACMAEAGVDAEHFERDDGTGVIIPTFIASLAGGNQDAIGAVIDACSRQEEAWVSKMYQLQPSTQNARNENLKRALPQIRKCLSEHGVAVDDDASPDEVAQASAQLSLDTTTEAGVPGVDCLVEAGVLNY